MSFKTSCCRAAIALPFLTLLSSLPTARSEDVPKVLQTFADEFVELTPGEGKFPASLFRLQTTGDPAKPVIPLNRFAVSKFEVYQSTYEFVMGNNPSRWKGTRNSAERMTYEEAIEFCKRITRMLRNYDLINDDEVIRLPTEVEWEYAARAGTTTRYSFGDDAQRNNDQGNRASVLDLYGWHTGNAAGNDPAVGVLKPNPWGLYDIHGYLWEYCLDNWEEHRSIDAVLPHQPLKNDSHQIVIRGGSWKDRFEHLTSASRRAFPTNGRDDAVGFRCVRVSVPQLKNDTQ